MVSFNCNFCQDVVTKPKIPNHARSCGSNSFSCVDCMQVFDLDSIKPHTSCVSEVAKYQGKYRSQANGNPVKRERPLDSSDDESKPAPPPKTRRPMPTFSDSDDEEWVKAKPVKKSEKAVEAVPVAKATAVAAPKQPSNKVTSPPSKPVKTASVIEVKSIVLGNANEVADVARNVLDTHQTKNMSVKALSKALVERYTARIAKQLVSSLEVALAEAGSVVGLELCDGVVKTTA